MIGLVAVLALSAAPLGAQPTRPSPTPEQRAQAAALQQAFCDGSKKLGELARTNFSALDAGARSKDSRRSAISLPDAPDCYITFRDGVATHWCVFPARRASLRAQVQGMSMLLARCLGAPAPELVEAGDFIAAEVESPLARYSVQGNVFPDGVADVSLIVRPPN